MEFTELFVYVNMNTYKSIYCLIMLAYIIQDGYKKFPPRFKYFNRGGN